MKITPNYSAHDWHELTFETEDDWLRAIDIFVERIKERFLNPIEKIEKCEYAGFAVLALDCLLIEMLQQFRKGLIKTPSGQSKDFFVDFLTQTSFGEFFDKRQATLFYRQIRCGILHQAEIRGSSKILIEEEIPLVKYDDQERGLLVNRRLFHKQLLSEFNNYVSKLSDSSNTQLRNRFRRKMKMICKTACEIV